MFDFMLGSKEDIQNHEKDFLVAVKRMLPRWLNSIPDSEFISICDLADSQGKKFSNTEKMTFVETGVGASTLALAWYSAKYNLHTHTWDTSSAKAAAIRQVLSEVFSEHLGSVNSYWTLVPWMSTSEHLGITALGKQGYECCLSFHDSEHTWSNVSGELQALTPLLVDGSVVALDDANLKWTETNFGLVNTHRKKLGWPLIQLEHLKPEPKGEIHWKLAKELLEQNFESVEMLDDFYKSNFEDDPYFGWYSTEFIEKVKLGTEVRDELKHRFDSFKVSVRK
jgi:hypothetical protein